MGEQRNLLRWFGGVCFGFLLVVALHIWLATTTQIPEKFAGGFRVLLAWGHVVVFVGSCILWRYAFDTSERRRKAGFEPTCGLDFLQCGCAFCAVFNFVVGALMLSRECQ